MPLGAGRSGHGAPILHAGPHPHEAPPSADPGVVEQLSSHVQGPTAAHPPTPPPASAPHQPAMQCLKVRLPALWVPDASISAHCMAAPTSWAGHRRCRRRLPPAPALHPTALLLFRSPARSPAPARCPAAPLWRSAPPSCSPWLVSAAPPACAASRARAWAPPPACRWCAPWPPPTAR